MEEVVMVGYGSQKRKEISASVVSIKTDLIPKSANTSVNNILQGRAAGLNLDLRSAQPGGRLNGDGKSNHCCSFQGKVMLG